MQPQGFPDSRRVRKRRDFLAIYDAGSKSHSNHFILFTHFLKGAPQRVGIAVSRKVGNAVERNRVKRLLRECFRTLDYCLPGCQIVIVAKPGAAQLTLSNVRAQLEPKLQRLCRGT